MCEACVDNPRWRTDLEDARHPTPERQAWDGLWQIHHDNGRARGMAPNAAARRADRLMEAVGPRPGTQPEEENQK